MRSNKREHTDDEERYIKPNIPDVKSVPSSSWASLNELGIGISWMWKNWLPKGFVSLLVGDVGIGKSTIALRVCASTLTGMNWLDGSSYIEEPGQVIWCEAESGQFMNIDRAKRWNLPMEKILTPLEDAFADFNLSNSVHRDALEEKINNHDIKLVVVDSLRGAIEGDENKSEQITQLKFCAQLAQKYQIPLLIVHHLRKKSKYDSMRKIDIDRIRGSSAIAQIPRIIIGLNIPNPDFPDKRKLEVIKNNLGKYPEPIGISITDHGIDTILDIEKWSNPKSVSQKALAKQFLTEILCDGCKLSSNILTEAKNKEINEQTLRRAKEDLGIRARREGKFWVWEFPSD